MNCFKKQFIVVFKEIARAGDGKPKGNVDVNLALHAMLKRDHNTKVR